MKVDFSIPDGDKCDKIFLLGCGFSIDLFDFNLIDNKSIVIGNNSIVSIYNKLHYWVASNFFTYRDSVTKHLLQHTIPITCAKMSPDPAINSKDFITNTKILRDVLVQVRDKIFVRKPIFVDYITNIMLLDKLKDKNNFINVVENRVFPCTAGSTAPMFILGYYLALKHNIDKIYYAGIDLLEINGFRYPKKLRAANDYNPASILPGSFKYKEEEIKGIMMYPNYGLQHFLVMVLLSVLPEDFFNMLESASFFDYKKLLSYDKLQRYKDFFITNILSQNKKDNYGYNLFPIMLREYNKLYNYCFNGLDLKKMYGESLVRLNNFKL